MFLITYDTRIFSAPESHFSDKRLCPRKEFTMEKIFKIDIFVSNMILTILNRFRPKKFSKNFWFFGHQFFKKTAMSPKKNFQRENFFRYQFFRFKIRFETFWIDSKKKFRKFFFENFHFLTIFVKKWLSPRKNFKGKIFSISTFSV